MKRPTPVMLHDTLVVSSLCRLARYWAAHSLRGITRHSGSESKLFNIILIHIMHKLCAFLFITLYSHTAVILLRILLGTFSLRESPKPFF